MEAASASARLLVVDDEATILELLSGSLRLAGFEVMTAASGAEAVRATASGRPDLVLLDVMMPDGDGLEALRRIRSGGADVPVIFLTARDEVPDRVSGFAAGADDYVTKPFSLEELLGRIRAVLKRTRPGAAGSQLRVADLELDEDAHEVRRAGALVALTPTEYRLLRFLMVNAGRVVSKDQILDQVWEYDPARDGSVVEPCVSYLRRKVDQGQPRLIHTVRGFGYVLRIPAVVTDEAVRSGRRRTAVRAVSLRTRVMAAAALLVVITALVTAVLGTTLLRSYLLSRSDAQLRDFAKVASRIVERQQLQPADSSRSPALPTQFLVEVIGADGPIQVAGGPLGSAGGLPLSAAQLSDTATPFTAVAAGAAPGSWRVLVQRLSGGGHLVIAYSLGDLDSTVTRLEVADALAAAVAVVLLAGLGLPLVRASLAPLARIEATAAAIARGDLSRRVDHPAGNTEVGRLAESLDVMLASIETAYLARADGEGRALRSQERMRRFVADASHELRTPLTSVRGLAEYAMQQGTAASPEELLRLMSLIGREADRMGRLVADLLLLARFDAGRPLQRRPMDLASLAAEAVQRARITDPGRPFTLQATEPVIIDGDEERLAQIVDNLLGNAVRHTPRGSPVTVTVTGRASRAELTVADHGPGMTAEQASHVFERFYRTDGARTRDRGGTGLGLAIAVSLAVAHGGQITVDTAPGHGAAFRLRLPQAETPQGTATRSQGQLR